jgi:hypothetical protein
MSRMFGEACKAKEAMEDGVDIEVKVIRSLAPRLSEFL